VTLKFQRWHQLGRVMDRVLVAEPRDDGVPRDRVRRRQVVREMEPLVRDDVAHRARNPERGDVVRDEVPERRRDRQRRHEDRDDAVGRDQHERNSFVERIAMSSRTKIT
jgi:hypothetical protein